MTESALLALGGRPIVLGTADKALYHLSAVMMGNLLTGLAAPPHSSGSTLERAAPRGCRPS
jgi:predicted short-subunit dehydrogenase-like oxidoreductase (DUF2520 family)